MGEGADGGGKKKFGFLIIIKKEVKMKVIFFNLYYHIYYDKLYCT